MESTIPASIKLQAPAEAEAEAKTGAEAAVGAEVGVVDETQGDADEGDWDDVDDTVWDVDEGEAQENSDETKKDAGADEGHHRVARRTANVVGAARLVDGGRYCLGDWERHTKGFGSRMLAKMGYRRGDGMNADGTGLVKPIEVEVLPEGRSLDFIRCDDADVGGGGGGGVKRGRGGAQGKHQTGAACGAQQPKRQKPVGWSAKPRKKDQGDMFGFLNRMTVGLGGGAKLRPDQGNARSDGAAKNKNGAKQNKPKSKKAKLKELNQQIIAQQERVVTLQGRLMKLRESKERNQSYDPHLAGQASRRIGAVETELRVAKQRLEAMREQSQRQRGGLEKAAKHIF